MSGRIVRWPFWVVFALALAWGAIATWRQTTRPTQILATTECPWRGAPRIVVSPDVAPEDTQPVRVHEAVHAAQCNALGPLRYRLQNLWPGGKLALEVPAYCAAAAARLSAGLDSLRVSERLRDDVIDALSNVADPATVDAALRKNCPAIIAVSDRTAGSRPPRGMR